MKLTIIKKMRRFVRSKVALALPVTFLILFVSTLGIVAFTYYFSVERISSQGQTLKVSTAKENLLSFNDAVISTLWQPGSSSTFEISDSGGIINIQPETNLLTLNVSDSFTLQETIFNASIGQIFYELPYSRSSQTGLYLKGDSRTITSQSGVSVSQLCIENGAERVEIQLKYRPTVTYVTAGTENGRSVNNIRIYVININESQPIRLYGSLPLKISCVNTQLTSEHYTVSSATQNLVITSILDGENGRVSVPISSTATGAIINLETVVSNISIERWIR